MGTGRERKERGECYSYDEIFFHSDLVLVTVRFVSDGIPSEPKPQVIALATGVKQKTERIVARVLSRQKKSAQRPKARLQ